MEYLLDLEIAGNKIIIHGDKKGILSIIVEHESALRLDIVCGKKELLN